MNIVKSILMPLCLLLLLGFANCFADEPIKSLQVKPNEAALKTTGRPPYPKIIMSEKDAQKYFDADELKKLSAKVDFKKQIVLLFTWHGSSRDQLTYRILESYPEQVPFIYTPGRTRDRRPHSHVYVLRKNVIWRAPKGADKILAMTKKPTDQYIKVEAKGTLDSHVIAIGGETTGVTITASGATWELDFADNKELRAKANNLHSKSVIIKGHLTVKKGVEFRERRIVKVSALVEAKPNQDK